MGLTIDGNQWGKGLISKVALLEDTGLENLDADSAASKLSEIARFAFGTKNAAENENGGFGRIGLVDGRVVKFATSRADRLFVKTTDEMRAACNQLRTTLSSLAETYLKAIGNRLGDDNKYKNELETIREQLGLKRTDDGKGSVFKEGVGLLDRKVVASVLGKLETIRFSAETEVNDRNEVLAQGQWLYSKYENQVKAAQDKHEKIPEGEIENAGEEANDIQSSVKAASAEKEIAESFLNMQKRKNVQYQGNVDKIKGDTIPTFEKPFQGRAIIGSFSNQNIGQEEIVSENVEEDTEVQPPVDPNKNVVNEKATEEVKKGPNETKVVDGSAQVEDNKNAPKVIQSEPVEKKTASEIQLDKFVDKLKGIKMRNNMNCPIDWTVCDVEKLGKWFKKSFELFNKAEGDGKMDAFIENLTNKMSEVHARRKWPTTVYVKGFVKEVDAEMAK